MPISHIKISDAGIVIDTLCITDRSLPMTIEYGSHSYRLEATAAGTLTLAILTPVTIGADHES